MLYFKVSILKCEYGNTKSFLTFIFYNCQYNFLSSAYITIHQAVLILWNATFYDREACDSSENTHILSNQHCQFIFKNVLFDEWIVCQKKIRNGVKILIFPSEVNVILELCL